MELTSFLYLAVSFGYSFFLENCNSVLSYGVVFEIFERGSPYKIRHYNILLKTESNFEDTVENMSKKCSLPRDMNF